MNIFKIPVIGQLLDLIGLDGEFGIQHTDFGGGCKKSSDVAEEAADCADGQCVTDNDCPGGVCDAFPDDEYGDEAPMLSNTHQQVKNPRFGTHDALPNPSMPDWL